MSNTYYIKVGNAWLISMFLHFIQYSFNLDQITYIVKIILLPKKLDLCDCITSHG